MAEKPITTSRLLVRIKRSGTFREAVTWHDDNDNPRFHQELYAHMNRREMDASELIRLTRIDRSYFYHILSGKKLPRRNMTLRICCALRLSVRETNHMLQLSDAAALYAKNRRDAVLIYGLEKKVGIVEANNMLLEAGEDPLFV